MTALCTIVHRAVKTNKGKKLNSEKKKLKTPNLTSTDLISSELSGREATQFTMAVTNQNKLIGR